MEVAFLRPLHVVAFRPYHVNGGADAGDEMLPGQLRQQALGAPGLQSVLLLGWTNSDGVIGDVLQGAGFIIQASQQGTIFTQLVDPTTSLE